MNFDDYNIRLPYPARPSRAFKDLYSLNPKEAAEEVTKYQVAEATYRTKMKEYVQEEERLRNLFKADAIKEAGLEGHPRAHKAYSMAWQRGHSSGYSDVMSALYEFAELLLED